MMLLVLGSSTQSGCCRFCTCARLDVTPQVLGKAEAAALAGSAEVVRTTLVTAGAVASGRVPVALAQKPGGKVSGLLNAERLMVARQLEEHFSMNGAATGAVLDSKVTGGCGCQGRSRTGLGMMLLFCWVWHPGACRGMSRAGLTVLDLQQQRHVADSCLHVLAAVSGDRCDAPPGQ